MDIDLNYLFVGLGFALIGLESLILSFYLVWFGFSFLIVGSLGLILNYENLVIEILISLILSLVLMFVYKKYISKKVDSNPELEKNFLDEIGYGHVNLGKLSYKGVLFNIINDDKPFKENEKVKVLSINLNNAKIERLEEN